MIIKSVRLVNTSGSHNKFYEIEIHQNDYGFNGHNDYTIKTRWGRIGRVPREAEKGSFESLERADKVLQDLTQVKYLRGYVIEDDIAIPFFSPPQAIQHEKNRIWTHSEINSNPEAFSKALRTALQKGA